MKINDDIVNESFKYNVILVQKFQKLTVQELLDSIVAVELMGTNAKVFLLMELIKNPQNNLNYFKLLKYLKKRILKDKKTKIHQKLLGISIIPSKSAYRYNKLFTSVLVNKFE